MTMQPPKEELSPYGSPDGVALFSDKVVDRLSAMSASQTCCLVSSDGTTKYPVHQAKLQEQSKVLRWAQQACMSPLHACIYVWRSG